MESEKFYRTLFPSFLKLGVRSPAILSNEGLQYFNNKVTNQKFYFSGGNLKEIFTYGIYVSITMTIIISDKKTKLPLGTYTIVVPSAPSLQKSELMIVVSASNTIYKNKTKTSLKYGGYEPNWNEVGDLFYYEEEVLEKARQEAATKIITAEEELKQTLEKAQIEAEIKIIEAKKVAQQLIDDATLDWESKKAIFDKYNYDSVNEALKTKYFTDSELSDEDILSTNILKKGDSTKSEQVLELVKPEMSLQKFAHPILKHMKG